MEGSGGGFREDRRASGGRGVSRREFAGGVRRDVRGGDGGIVGQGIDFDERYAVLGVRAVGSRVVGVTDKLVDKYDAVKFAKLGSEIIGGKGGGGRKDFAQAGGQDSSKIDEAFEKIKSLI